jgi:hypothetical protein
MLRAPARRMATLLGALAVVAATSIAALAQAGSTGGTVGNTDKSISGGGGEEQPAVRQGSTPKPRTSERPAANSCQKIVGTWAWHFTLGTTETVFRPDGTASNSSGLTNSWTCSGGTIIAHWSHGGVDHIRISSDGNSLKVTVAECAGVPTCVPGMTFPATRK